MRGGHCKSTAAEARANETWFNEVKHSKQPRQLSLRSSTPNKKFPYEKYRYDMRAEAQAAGGRLSAAFDLFFVCHNYLYIAYFPPRKLGVISEA